MEYKRNTTEIIRERILQETEYRKSSAFAPALTIMELSEIMGVPYMVVMRIFKGETLIENTRYDYAWRIIRTLRLNPNEILAATG